MSSAVEWPGPRAALRALPPGYWVALVLLAVALATGGDPAVPLSLLGLAPLPAASAAPAECPPCPVVECPAVVDTDARGES